VIGERPVFNEWENEFSRHLLHKKSIMGRGDKKTKKGKIFKGSFGKSRPAGEKKITGNKVATKKES
jgi:30S ribosomal protein S31